MPKIDATRLTNDKRKNPRYAVHFLGLLTKEENYSSFLSSGSMLSMIWLLQRAKYAGGKKFHNKQSRCSGIVYQSYAGIEKEVKYSLNCLNNQRTM